MIIKENEEYELSDNRLINLLVLLRLDFLQTIYNPKTNNMVSLIISEGVILVYLTLLPTFSICYVLDFLQTFPTTDKNLSSE